jgi:hypothetical protein
MNAPSTLISQREGMTTRRSRVLLFVSLVAASVLASGLVLASVLMARPADAALTCGTSWRSVPLPTGIKYPQALAPIAANNIWVVGNSKPGIGSDMTTARWNGSRWTLFPIRKLGTGGNELNGADGVASDDVWAVGAYAATEASPYKTLVEHWNGSQWQVVASPNVGAGTKNTLTSVDALSRTSAWAVGSYRTPASLGNDPVRKTLIQRWNGTSWTIVSSPNPGTLSNSLLGVAATGQNDIWAVGWKIGSQGLRSLILHYDGTAWTEAAVPTVGTGENVLTDISALSANDIWASGYYDEGTQQKTLTLHYDGSSWSSVPSASRGDGVSILNDISATSPSAAWAVGFEYRASLKRYVATTQRWNGSAWSAVPSAISRTNANESVLYSVAKVPRTSQVWAAGQPQDAEVICPSGSTTQASPTQATMASTDPAAPAEAPNRTTQSTTSDATEASNTSVAPPTAAIPVTALDKAVDAGISQTTKTRGAIIADFNNDGSPDIFLGRHNASTARLYTNDGSGHFTEIDQGTFVKTDRHGCDAADVNSDGLKDIFCSEGANQASTPKRNELWVQKPDHTFVDQAGQYGLSNPFSRGRINTFIDANGDDRPDLFLANEADRLDALPTPNQLFTNQEGTTFRSAPGYGLEREMDYSGSLLGGTPGSLSGSNPSVADLDKDGWQDLLVATTSGLHVYHNDQGNGFTEVAASVGLGQNPADVSVADVNGDGWPDVIEVLPNELRVMLNTNGTFSSVFSTTLQDGVSVAAGDVNGDDRPDIYVLRGAPGANAPDQVYLNNGSGTGFAQMSWIPSTSQGQADFVAPIDHDGNGLTDFLVLNGETATPGPVQLIAFFPASP